MRYEATSQCGGSVQSREQWIGVTFGEETGRVSLAMREER